MKSYDCSAPATTDSGIFGLTYSPIEARLVLLPIPWEATTSYGGGTAKGPEAILQASKQVDLFNQDLGNFFEVGIAMLPDPKEVQEWNKKAKKIANEVTSALVNQEDTNIDSKLSAVNELSEKMNQYVYQTTQHYLKQNKLFGLIGGDHSCPFGSIKALVEKYPNLGILHIDAHADLRKAYSGFEYSHASIMYNVLTKTPLKKLVQVGIRDYCEEEYRVIMDHPEKVKTFFDADLAERKIKGDSWAILCDDIINQLPNEVYISFDIDGLDPRFCPNTGTPVPGGLEFNEILYLFKQIAVSGRTIVGFDLNEVSPGENSGDSEWDANVGARILMQLCGWTIKTQKDKVDKSS